MGQRPVSLREKHDPWYPITELALGGTGVHMHNSLLNRPTFWRSVLPVAVVAVAAIGLAGEADADPSVGDIVYGADADRYGRDICAMVEENPVLGVFDEIKRALLSQTNVSMGSTGGVIGLSVKRYCPSYLPLASRYYNFDPVPAPTNQRCENILAEPGMAGNVSCPSR